ncbi:hypothetical protein QM012_009384 [Aureobasidium pullulans]|uniref:BTB domain-containing protein n=1 Tax=Aureobasidium pullulans TaxID=5580 RepID=A0ABR0TGQ1_AURPU
MSFNLIKGSDTYADARLLTFDGFVIPFHRVIFLIKGLQGCKFEALIRDQFRDPQSPIRLDYDGQTVWRVISFVYEGTYQDDDEDLAFPKVEPPASPASVSRLSSAPTENQDVALVQGFRKLHITSQSCTSAALLKALASVKVYRAASDWDFDRLMIEAGQRFGEYVSGAFDRDDFPQFVDAVFNSVAGPAELLYDPLVRECFTHCQHLVENKHFLTILEHNGKLAVRLYRELAKFQGSLNDGTSAELPPGLSSLGTGISAFTSAASSAAASSTPALLQSQLAEARDAIAAKVEQIKTLEHEVAHLKESVQQKVSLPVFEVSVPRVNADKDVIINRLEHQLDQKDQKIGDLERILANVNARNAMMVGQINSKRAGQPDSTSFLLERNEARDKVKELQSCLTASEGKTKEREAQLAAHTQQPVSVNTAFIPQSSTNNVAKPAQRPQNAEPKRQIFGFGAMTASVNSIGAGSASATAPESPASPTPSVLPLPAPASGAPSSGGPISFFEKLSRSRAAGIHGGEHESTTSSHAPPSMSVSARGDAPTSQQPARSPSVTPSISSTITANAPSPVNSTPRGPHAALGRSAVGPYSPQTNGGSHVASRPSSVTTSPHVVGTSQSASRHVNGNSVTHRGASTNAHVSGPDGTPSAAPDGTTPTASSAVLTTAANPSANISNGQGHKSPDKRDNIIRQLQAQNAFLQTQLNDARFGPASNIQPRGRGGHRSSNQGSSGSNARLDGVLKALREFDLDHKSCNDCSINFNAQWRGMVDDVNDPDLILMCNRCGNEKCRWRC